MKAFVLNRYGGPDAAQMLDLPVPEPAAGEVLVRVKAAGLNPVDFKTREGKLKVVAPYRLPTTMGNELAGVVERVGPGVSRFAPGNRVFARTAKNAMGAFAEFAIVPENLLAIVPAPLDFPAAAGIPLAGLTALQALRDEMGIGPGSRVFIPGGAGGVGTFAIQIAKGLGAHVITTASPRGRELVERLGANEVIDYTSQQFEDLVSGVDGVFDLIGGDTLTKAFGVVKTGGMVLSVTALPEPQTALKDLKLGFGYAALFWLISLPLRLRAWRHGVRYRFLFMHPSGPELDELGRMVEDSRLTPVIDRVFPFAELPQALAYLEQGRAKGKVVVQMDA